MWDAGRWDSVCTGAGSTAQEVKPTGEEGACSAGQSQAAPFLGCQSPEDAAWHWVPGIIQGDVTTARGWLQWWLDVGYMLAGIVQKQVWIKDGVVKILFVKITGKGTKNGFCDAEFKLEVSV